MVSRLKNIKKLLDDFMILENYDDLLQIAVRKGSKETSNMPKICSKKKPPRSIYKEIERESTHTHQTEGKLE